MCLSISSTLVVLKTLLDRGELDSLHGKAAIGWTIVQDIATIVFIVSLPPLAGGDLVGPFVLAIAKAAIFLVLAFVVGTRLFPWIFATVARLGSNELFLMAVVATALLTAFVSSALFGLSLALGAFVAGLVVSDSDLSHQVAGEVVPFRDLFAVLFFVSVGMLVDPGALVADAGLVVVLVILAVIGKGLVTGALARGLGLPARSAVLLGATMAQVGEFSFILAEDGLDLGLISERAYNLVLGTAVVSILVGSLATRVADRLVPYHRARAIERARPAPASAVASSRARDAAEPAVGDRRRGPVADGHGRRAPAIPDRGRARSRRGGPPARRSWCSGRAGSDGSWSRPCAGGASAASSSIAIRGGWRRSPISARRRSSATPRTRRSCAGWAWSGRRSWSWPSATH